MKMFNFLGSVSDTYAVSAVKASSYSRLPPTGHSQ